MNGSIVQQLLYSQAKAGAEPESPLPVGKHQFALAHQLRNAVIRAVDGHIPNFNGHQDDNAICYLTLANELIHEVNPKAITIAEEVSDLDTPVLPQAAGLPLALYLFFSGGCTVPA